MRNSHSARLLVTRWAVGPLALALAGALALCPSAASAAGTRAKPPNLAYAVTFSSNSALYRLFPRSHRAALAGRTGVTLTDITFRGQILYAISFTTLYRLNAANGARHQVGSLGLSSANALATQPRTNILYGADQHGDFFKINARTGHATVIGTFGHHLSSSGDLAFANGRLYATVVKPNSTESILATVNVRTGAARTIGRTGYQRVWGLVAGTQSLYGATYSGDFLSISARTGRARVIWKEGLAIGGMAVPSLCPRTPQAVC
jgi:hypothetical protein